MAAKKATPKFTAQIRAVLVLDVEIDGGDLSGAIELAKTFKRSDLVTQLDDAVTVADESYAVVGAWTANAWNAEQS